MNLNQKFALGVFAFVFATMCAYPPWITVHTARFYGAFHNNESAAGYHAVWDPPYPLNSDRDTTAFRIDVARLLTQLGGAFVVASMVYLILIESKALSPPPEQRVQ